MQISSNGTGGGNWASTATWAGGVVPLQANGDTGLIVPGDSVDQVPAGEVCDEVSVSAFVTDVYGTVSMNSGSVLTVKSGGTVTTNYGGITTVEAGGTVGLMKSSGTLTSNYGTVTDTEAGSVITSNYGTVTTCSGGITTNQSGGTVGSLLGTVSDNYGTITTIESAGSLTGNGNGGVVTTNNGYIYDNLSGGLVVTNSGAYPSLGIMTNNGTVTTNNANIGRNVGTITANENGAYVTYNDGTVTWNKDGAVIEQCNAGTPIIPKNDGMVTSFYQGDLHNYAGTVANQNGGTVWIHGVGTVTNRYGGTLYLTAMAISYGGVGIDPAAFSSPGAENVKLGVTYKYDGADVVGTLPEAAGGGAEGFGGGGFTP